VLALQPYLKANPGKTRDDYDYEVSKIVLAPSPDLIVLAGWMHILGDAFLKEVERKNVSVINLHPALPGAFDGANSIERAFEAFKRGDIEQSGVMVHKVIREVDRGEPVLVRTVEMKVEDTLEDFEQRLHQTEWGVIVEAAKIVLETRRYVLPFQRVGPFFTRSKQQQPSTVERVSKKLESMTIPHLIPPACP
jgi:phosphoribosylglycinamide formyltransferase